LRFAAAPAIADNPQPRKIYSGWIPYYSMKDFASGGAQ
jgi:hypothetical protein